MSQAPLLPLPPVERRKHICAAIPAWFPQYLRTAAQGITSNGSNISFAFSRGERQVMRRRKPMPVSQWAEKYRMVEMSAIPGRWHNLFTPYLVGIMDTMAHPGVETVIVCKSPQTGGSEAGHNFVGYCIDRCPGPVMYVYPDELTARENAKDRIIPMIQASPRLREYMTGYGDDTSSLRINLMHMPIYLAWSGSVSRLGNKPIRVLILDELDKYKDPKNEATSEALAEMRVTTWRRRGRSHVMKVSTPTTPEGPIWVAFTQEAQARFDYWVRCPHCGMFQLMQFERIAWPGKDTDEEPDAEAVLAQRLATYPCEHCGTVWDDNDRDRAVRGGQWRERESGLDLAACLASVRPSKVAFHIPAWISFFVSLSDVARQALKYKQTGSADELKKLQNQYKAQPWVVEHAARTEDSILALCDDRPRGRVPGPIEGKARISMLLAGIDTQKSHFRYVIRAFGFGDQEESWLVQAGVAETLSAIDAILWATRYRDADGHEYAVRAAMMDAMGGRTAEIYRYAVRHRGRVYPWQGVRSMSQPYTPTPQEYYPDQKGSKIRIPGGINLWRCDTTFFKDDLSGKLSINASDPGAFHLHSNEKRELEEYAREMCAEAYDDEQHAWVNPHSRANHYWDCEVMCKALAYILNVRNTRPPQGEKKRKPVTGVRGETADIAGKIGSYRR